MEQSQWFANWFNTPYYHILYKNRNEKEAEFFIDNLFKKFSIPSKSKILDLACGKGRHAIFMNKKSVSVIGTDLSQNSIIEAKKQENENLTFLVQDMRKPMDKTFDFVFNLFTSIGYFENVNDNNLVFESVNKMLQPNGFFIIDFMNAKKVINELVAFETKNIDNIYFEIKKEVKNKTILKHITFDDKNIRHHYTEKVSILYIDDFIKMTQNTTLKLVETFGNYNLDSFDENNSDRLILAFQKN